MVVSPQHFKDVTNGYEKRTDGLWVHKGMLSVGLPGIRDAPKQAGDLNVNRGGGQGVVYFGGTDNASGVKYLHFDGTNFNLVGGSLSFTPSANTIPTAAIQDGAVTSAKIADGGVGTVDLAANAVTNSWVFQSAPAGSTTSNTGVPMPSPFGSMTLTGYQGGRLVLHSNMMLLHSATNAVAAIITYLNGAIWLTSHTTVLPLANTPQGVVGMGVYPANTLAPGNPIVAFYWQTPSGTLSITTAYYSWAIWTEFKR